MKYKTGMLLFPELTVQDFIGPYEVFIRASCFEVYTISETTAWIHAEGGLTLQADHTFEDCPQLDIIFVPGGRGITSLLLNKAYHAFLQQQAMHAQYITSVCTGSLLLAAAGLLKGYKATTHWRSMELLAMMDVDTVAKRVVIDSNRITGGGITAGIDFALTLTSQLGGDEMAKTIQLMLEYDPEPPFQSGSPGSAEPHIFKRALEASQAVFDSRRKIIQQLLSPEK
jgi:cyclohexyl-isocyanide hydratase